MISKLEETSSEKEENRSEEEESENSFENISSLNIQPISSTAMSSSGNSASNVHIEKLQGRENYNTWQFAMKTYLELEDLWNCVIGTETDQKKIIRARAKIILAIDPINYIHVMDATTAKGVWDKLKLAFEDSGLTRRVGLLRTLISVKLSSCKSIDEYVSIIITTAHKLNGIGFQVNEEWIGTLLLAGLSEEYKPMIMGLESSGMNITGDLIKTKLLQEVKTQVLRGKEPENNNALFSKDRYKKFNKGPRCYNCNLYGHTSPNCPKKKNTRAQKGTQQSFFSAFTTGDIDSHQWYIDSGASAHMTMHGISNLQKLDNQQITLANNSKLMVNGKGKMELEVCKGDGGHSSVEVQNVLHVPQLAANLLSVLKIVTKGNTVIFDKYGCKIFNKNKDLLATGSIVNGMFQLDRPCLKPKFAMAANTAKNEIDLWHRRLGHMNIQNMLFMKQGYVSGINFKEGELSNTCIPCVEGKQQRNPFKHVGQRAGSVLELVHSDLCGPMETKSLGGSRYFLTFIDDFSRKVFIYFLKTKDQGLTTFEDFKAYAEKQTGFKLKVLRTDNGTEYVNKAMLNYLRKEGICHQTTTPYTPEQNGMAERMNRTLVEKARCMLIDSGLNKEF